MGNWYCRQSLRPIQKGYSGYRRCYHLQGRESIQFPEVPCLSFSLSTRLDSASWGPRPRPVSARVESRAHWHGHEDTALAHTCIGGLHWRSQPHLSPSGTYTKLWKCCFPSTSVRTMQPWTLEILLTTRKAMMNMIVMMVVGRCDDGEERHW